MWGEGYELTDNEVINKSAFRVEDGRRNKDVHRAGRGPWEAGV